MRRRILLPCLLVSPILAGTLAFQAGLRFNHTDSCPIGFYRMAPKVPDVGDLVMFFPPALPVFDLAQQRGYVSPGECLLKRIVTGPGDVVTIDAAGVTVNGQRIPNTEPRTVDLAGRPLPVFRLQGYQLQPDEVLLISDYSPLSFDGRYFGPVSCSQIQSVVVPVWTW
jgi:conjugative transfer signal peptidase TraF